MCTLLILFRPNNKWPLIVAGNRDELLNRKWTPPGYHWKKHSSIVAGKDLVAGGSWLGINKNNMVATVLNRPNSLGPSKTKLSRGFLPLIILKHTNLKSAINELESLDFSKWQPFNLFFGNHKEIFWAKNSFSNKIIINNITPGKHILDSYDLNSFDSPRIKFNYNLFKRTKNPNPSKNNWDSWIKLLSSEKHPKKEPLAAINVSKNKTNYGTSSSSLIAIPSLKNQSKKIFLFNCGSPKKNNFYPIIT